MRACIDRSGSERKARPEDSESEESTGWRRPKSFLQTVRVP